MIVDLVRQRKRVAITAQSHKTISNLLEAVVDGGERRRRSPSGSLQKADEDDAHVGHLDGVTRVGDNADVAAALDAGTVDVVAGTAWLFARPEFDGAFDVLFVDEASQLSLANAVAVGTCARSLVLIGDPNQLPMVSQGVHPPGAAATSLEHLVGDAATLPDERGLFLATSRRLHPAVNAFISPAFYDGLLDTHPDTALRVVDGADPLLSGAGVRWLPTPHTGNGPRSRQEAEVVAEVVARLVGMTWRDREHGVRTDRDRRHHRGRAVQRPGRRDPGRARAAHRPTSGNVGTVDKFQGREGAVAIYSMASSSRRMRRGTWSFLYSRNRLNVAISRAQSVASSSPRRRSSRPAAERPSRCAWSMRSAGSSRRPRAGPGRGRRTGLTITLGVAAPARAAATRPARLRRSRPRRAGRARRRCARRGRRPARRSRTACRRR